MKQHILIADDDADICSALALLLNSKGFTTIAVQSPEAALAAVREHDFSLALIDLNYSLDTTSGEEGVKLIASIQELDEALPIIVMTAWGTIDIAVKAIKSGANDFVQKPWENDQLLNVIQTQIKLANSQKQALKLRQENTMLREEAGLTCNIIAESPTIRHTLDTLNRVAKSDASVLLTGENGTGKSLFANYLHTLSLRSNASLISVNMGAVTESLFESEMFGHVKGAFTDAKENRIGRFELADKGSLFLDEIANTPYSQQGKLLRVLEDSQFEKVGTSKTKTVDVRLITATNSDLNAAVNDGKFRKDLLYRINTVEIHIPPLRNRVDDIIPLAKSFLQKAATKYAKTPLSISNEAVAMLKTYSWPGNVRELSNVMERAQILCQGNTIQSSDLALSTDTSSSVAKDITNAARADDLRPLAQVEADLIQARLQYFNGNALKAAESLGLSRSAFYRKLEKLKA